MPARRVEPGHPARPTARIETIVLGKGTGAARLLFLGSRCELRVARRIIHGDPDFAAATRFAADPSARLLAPIAARSGGNTSAAEATVARLLHVLQDVGVSLSVWPWQGHAAALDEPTTEGAS